MNPNTAIEFEHRYAVSPFNSSISTHRINVEAVNNETQSWKNVQLVTKYLGAVFDA